jgi:iron complex outermembrane recepter protein
VTEMSGKVRRCRWVQERVLRSVGLLASLGVAATSAATTWAQQPPADLTKVNIEDLMNMEVTSASKKEQKLSSVAAAIFVITPEDIRRSGATNIPDLLRMVPGLDVAQINGSTWAIGARGFNQQFSNKLLVMIDSRIVYTPNFAGVYWDTLDVPLEDIERIEVIRGPGGSIWGVNAVDGVISIFTKKASDTAGGMVEAEGGNQVQGAGTAQYGGKLGKDTDYRIFGKYFNDGAEEDLAGQNGADGWHLLHGGFRADSTLSSKDSLTVEGDLYSGREGEYGFYLPSILSPSLIAIPEEIDLSGGSLQSAWHHVYSEHSDSTLQVSYTRYGRGDPLEPETRDTVFLDYQDHFAWGRRQDIVWGLGYEYTSNDVKGSLTVSFDPPGRVLQVFNSFVQDEITLVPDRVYLTAGAKLEHNDYTGFAFMPSARVSWTLRDHQMFWAAVSRALRAPSQNDTNLVVNLGSSPGPNGIPILTRFEGNPNFQNEQLIAYEAGYRSSFSDRFSIDVAAYADDYTHLQTTEPSGSFFEPTPLPPHEVQTLTYENLMYGQIYGLEIAGNWKLSDRWSLRPAYALCKPFLHTEPASQDTTTAQFVSGATPDESFNLRSHFDFTEHLAWDVSGFYVSPLDHQSPSSNVTIPSLVRLDSGLTWTSRNRFSVSVVGQNLLKAQHTEFEDVFGSMQSSEIKRSAYAKFTWQF